MAIGFIFIALMFCAGASAAAYPDRPVRLVVPVAPGGAVDVVGRIVGQKLSALLGQNFVTDNRAGANYIIGTELVARSVPDGYTLLITAGAHTINPAVYRKLPYDTLRDFAPISHIANSGGLVMWCIRHCSALATGADRYGAASPADQLRLGGIRQPHPPGRRAVPGNGRHQAHPRAIQERGARRSTISPGGQIPLMFGPGPVVVPMVQAGRLRPLAYLGLKRSAQLPDVPTVDDFGIKATKRPVGTGLYAPRGTPKAILDRLNASVRELVRMPDTRERFAALNLSPSTARPKSSR
jgi:tripartite-type tricarboxylate transporter receptor subunit TctC